MFRAHGLLPVFVVAVLLAVVHGGSENQVASGAAASAPTDPAFADDLLAFEDRVRYQRAIEEVYWRHRIWPVENPSPKPTIDQVLPDAMIRERVATYLEKSAALEVVWQRPLTGKQLQAEMDRMVRGTKKPDLLRELFDALDNDPLLIAECLVRPVLAQRLARDWYKRDQRFHVALQNRARAALAAHSGDTLEMPRLGGEYVETEWRRSAEEPTEAAPGRRPSDQRVVTMRTEEWREQIGRLAMIFEIDETAGNPRGGPALFERIPLGRISPLVEEDDRFVVTAVLSKQADALRTATVAWSKRPFDTWWSEEGRAAAAQYVRTTPGSLPSHGYELHAPGDSPCTADTWTPMWYLPSKRTYHSAVWTGAEMIVWGGYDVYVTLRTGGRYDPATDSWTEIAWGADSPSRRADFTAVWTGTEMIVWGGNNGSYINSGGRYDPLTDSWTPTSRETGVPSPRAWHTAVWTGTEMIVWGGYSYGISERTGGRYDPVSDSWTTTSTGSSVPVGRVDHTAVWTGTEMIVWGGGYSDSENHFLNSGGRYDPATDSWTETSTTAGAPAPRSWHSAVWTGTEMIVWGGGHIDSGYRYVNTGGRYNPASDSWMETPLTPGVPSKRLNHTAVWTGSEMLVWGGTFTDTEPHYPVTGGRYDPVADSWTATSTEGGVPSGRHKHTVVWTGTEMIVWGGHDPFVQNSGGRYDPATNSWTATWIVSGLPSARKAHTAVWTGTEMIVWGGKYAAWNTGGRYDPALDNWTATSTGAGCPDERSSYSVVWTGLEMIIWGGWTGEKVETGARYNPVTDSWTATSTGAGVPSPRSWHSAVWTGAEMIVWGGAGPNPGYLDSGGRYDPATDSWAATSTGSEVPLARYKHVAFWTGEEMLVWGGDGLGPGYLDTGGRYNPVTDSWMPTSTETGELADENSYTAIWTGREMIVWARWVGGRYDPAADSWTEIYLPDSSLLVGYRHSTAWTGEEMIVWGGSRSSLCENTGARYDPLTDSWSPTSNADGVAMARDDHTAVWTGTEMIVWGGSGERRCHNTTNEGAFYCLCEGTDVSIWYPDADGDGLGAGSTGIPACEQPPDHVATAGDCDDRFAECTTVCTDADLDGTPACAPDCNESNPYCTTDCTDSDEDGYCVTHDCEDTAPACTTVCTDADDDGLPVCAGDCDDANPHCTTDCMDADEDGYCVTHDCDDQLSECTTDCTDADADLVPACAGDCDDGDDTTYPNAPELNDGADNQCPGDMGYGLIDEITGVCGFHNPANRERFSWPAQTGAGSYSVARSTSPWFNPDCLVFATFDTYWADSDPVAQGVCHHYLVRPVFPNTGSWGENSEGVERTTVCP